MAKAKKTTLAVKVKKPLTIEELDAKIQKLNEKKAEIQAKLKPLNDAWGRAYKMVETLTDERDRLLLATKADSLTLNELIHYPEGSMVMFHHREKVLREMGLSTTGAWSDTGERSISFALYKSGSNRQKVLESLKTVIPMLTPHKDGFIWLSLSERTCSQYGVYHVHVKPDLTECELWITKYHRPSKICSYQSLDDMLDYIQRNHYQTSYDEPEEKEEEPEEESSYYDF